MEGEALPTQPPSAESGPSKNGTPEPTSAENKPEQNMTSREEAIAKLRSARDIISNYLDQGFFGNAEEAEYNQAKTALKYKGTGGDSDREASDQLLAMTASIKAIAAKDSQVQELNDYFTENIKVFNQANGQTYSLSEWEKQLSAIQNDDSLSADQKESEAKELEEKAFYGFLLKKEEVKVQEQPKSQEDRLISDSIENIKKEIDGLKALGQDTKEKESLLASFELANNTKGDLGIFFKIDALNKLKTAGYEGANGELVERLIKESSPAIEKATENLETYLKKCNISKDQHKQLMDIIKRGGDIEQLIMGGHFDKVEGLDKLIFGKEMTEQELLQMLSGEEKALYLFGKYGKKGLIGILLMLLLGAVQAADLAKGELGAR